MKTLAGRLMVAVAAVLVCAAPSVAQRARTGGCCLPNGSCVVTTQTNCAAQGGTYRGDRTNCNTPCVPTGGCCLPNGSCVVTTQASCTSQGGTYRGNATTCATPCPQPPVPVALHGVLVQSVSDLFCVRFEADNGDSYVLSNRGSFVAGDRVYVEGTVPQTSASVCENELTPIVTVSLIRPGFAGIGTIVTQSGQKRLQTDDGRVFALQNNGGFADGARVYTRGSVVTVQSPAQIAGNTIGAAFSVFGRLIGTPPGDRRVLGEDGVTYQLDAVGAHNAAASDYVYVEGILSSAADPRPVTSAAARFAFSTSGDVVSDGAGGKAFQADGVMFNDVFTVAGLSSFPIGAEVYVRGLRTDDYDYQEPRNGNSIRQARVGAGYSALGVLNLAAKTVTNVDNGAIVTLENTGPFPNGFFVYVAGEVASSGAGTVTLRHNQTLIGLELFGTLEVGFECAPLFVGGGGYYFLENTGGFPFGSSVTVRGGIMRKVAPCDFDSFINNTIMLGLPEQ